MYCIELKSPENMFSGLFNFYNSALTNDSWVGIFDASIFLIHTTWPVNSAKYPLAEFPLNEVLDIEITKYFDGARGKIDYLKVKK